MTNLRQLSDTQLKKLHQEKLNKFKSEKRYLNDKEQKLATQLPNLMAGGLDDVNKIIWPFWFTTGFLSILPETSVSRFISVSQEAAFVWTHITRAIFEKVELDGGIFEWNYIDPNDFQDGVVEDLQFTVTDAQSSRTFFDNPISLNHVGHAQEPEKLDSPMLIAANNNIEVKYFNNNAARTYVPSVTFHGYRVRIKDSQEILGFVNK
jgi:hypothetical protein